MTQQEFNEQQKQAREAARKDAQAILREANALRDQYNEQLKALKERARIRKMEYQLDTAKRRAQIVPDPLKAEKHTIAEAHDVHRCLTKRIK